MQETFYQYKLKTELAKKYSHSTYLASPTSESECQVILTVFASSLFHFPHEHEKFLKKARRVKELRHPGLVSILDMGLEQDQPFIVREYLPNGSLRSYLKKLSPDHLELGKALGIVSQVGLTLAYAHEHGIIHGNIKPENILLDASGQAILTDFNLVGRSDAIIRDQTTEEYAFCYLAPEQFSGVCNVKSDQYALGCLAYELITGRMPFAAQSLASIIGHQSTTDPIPFSDGIVDLPPSLEVAVLKALSKDPDERFDDFLLFLEVIQSVLSPPPAFPLTRSTDSHSSGAMSHSTQSTGVAIAVSPIRKRVARRSVPPLLEPPRAFFNNESSAIILGAIPQSEGSISGLDVATLIDEKETDGSLPADLFLQQEEEDESSVVTSLENAIYGRQYRAEDQISSSLIGSTDEIVSLAVPIQSRKRRPVGWFLLFALLVGLIIYASVVMALWTASILRPSGIVKPDTHSHVETKITQAATTQKTNNFTAASTAVQSANGPRVQPTTGPTTQSKLAVQSTTGPTTQSKLAVQSTSTPASNGFNPGRGYPGGGRQSGWGWWP